MSIPEEMKYQEPIHLLESASVQGSIKKNKGLLVANETISVFAIDGLLVNGFDGAFWSKKTAIAPGEHSIEVVYSNPSSYYGGALIKLNAEELIEYQVKFEQPFIPTQVEIESFKQKEGADFQAPIFWGKAWIENTETSEKMPYVLLPIYLVSTTVIPIII